MFANNILQIFKGNFMVLHKSFTRYYSENSIDYRTIKIEVKIFHFQYFEDILDENIKCKNFLGIPF